MEDKTMCEAGYDLKLLLKNEENIITETKWGKSEAGIVDYVLVNNKEISAEMQEYYAQKGQYPVLIDEKAVEDLGVGLFKADIIDDSEMIHHDSMKLAQNVMKIYHTLKEN